MEEKVALRQVEKFSDSIDTLLGVDNQDEGGKTEDGTAAEGADMLDKENETGEKADETVGSTIASCERVTSSEAASDWSIIHGASNSPLPHRLCTWEASIGISILTTFTCMHATTFSLSMLRLVQIASVL